MKIIDIKLKVFSIVFEGLSLGEKIADTEWQKKNTIFVCIKVLIQTHSC